MRVLLINFEMDVHSPVLPWQARVATALADRCEAVHVLTEKAGTYDPRPNMTVDVVPHWPWGVPKRLGGRWLTNFQLYRLLKKHKCDVCFMHMSHQWSYRFWFLLRWFKIPVLLWYAHGSTPWHLYLALACANRVITSTPEGFRIASPKVQVIGQAIDTGIFVPPLQPDIKPEILYVGRISPRKRILEMLDVFAALRQLDTATPWHLTLIGPTLTGTDDSYSEQVRARITALGLNGSITLPGAKTQEEIAAYYKHAALHLNLSETGSMDKTVMEALACGCPVLTSNIAFKEALAAEPRMLAESAAPAALAQRIIDLYKNRPGSAGLQELVRNRHDFAGWIDKVVPVLQSLTVQKD